ncbi:MAG: hypothetical protein QNJ73_14970 [Gammaproteobacteria bacterium]|nr:hypothetical protein [Gammaproteobacteria bacterium]
MTSIEEFLTRYRGAWRENSAAQLESFWDTSEPAPFYKAEEIDHIMASWDDLRDYWRHNEGFNEAIELQFSEINAVPVGPDRQLVGMRMRWDIRFAKDAKTMDGGAFSWAGQTMGGENHVVALLRTSGDDWRLCAWIEAPNAPITYMAQLYLQNVSPGFGAD